MSSSWEQLFFQILLLVFCRHINTKTPGPTPPPLVSISSPLPTDVRSVVLKGESHTESVELLNPVNLTLECTWTGNQNKLPNITGFWGKDGDEVENSRLTVQLENDQYNLKRAFSIVSEKNLGNYSCMFESEAKIDFVLAAPHMHEVRDKPIVSYVGDSVVIHCKMEETQPKPITWNWYKANGTDKIFTAAQPLRYEIKNDERKTKLVVYNLTEADRGLYYCGAVYAINTTMGLVELKVINFTEPLKPFIAIVIEVIVLVVAIMFYERYQSKKNYTAGNGMNDQTNTVTQGENNEPEEGSSMRQRKV
ncbi:embigin isoform X2 [Perca flavescens]|uniref:embigin isoform X2 n=1 Tax=Perca flavescens TaxID=8167 RepID=UPI00106E89ED|nr:embigin isoform X2 [Perca flavescens]